MNIHDDITVKLVNRLLVDVSIKARCFLSTPGDVTSEWFLIEAPTLDKKLLGYIEGRNLWPTFPEWLLPLSERTREGIDRDATAQSPTQATADDLRLLRQVLVFCYKAEYDPTNEQLENAQRAFEEAEDGVATWDGADFQHRLRVTLARARQIVGSIIYRIDWSKIVPHHGPGGVYPSRKPWNKGRFDTLYTSIDQHYPYAEYFCGLWSFWDQVFRIRAGDWKVSDSILANLVAVPKDSRGPRLICVHPAESIWIQQGQRAALESRITSHPLTRGRINFTDQTVNGKLALASSKTREFCTLDLKEASDRVSCGLVRSLFGDYAYNKLSCTRATHVKLLDGTVRELRKWAPMGNALCFPVESLVFYALVVSGILSKYGENCTEVYVFGDDIIFPVKYYDGVITTLVSAGLIPNVGKTFKTGFFRESCGVEAYGGFDITPLRLKKASCVSLSNIVSLLDLAKRLRFNGYDVTASFMYATVRRALEDRGECLPLCNNPDTSGLVEYVDMPATDILLRERNCSFNQRYQLLVVKHKTPRQSMWTGRNGDWYHLQESLIGLSRRREAYGERGLEYPIPYRVRLSHGWTALLLKEPKKL